MFMRQGTSGLLGQNPAMQRCGIDGGASPSVPPLASPVFHSQRLNRNSTSKSPAPPQVEPPSTPVRTSWKLMRLSTLHS
jgi:hypothetical protein